MKSTGKIAPSPAEDAAVSTTMWRIVEPCRNFAWAGAVREVMDHNEAGCAFDLCFLQNFRAHPHEKGLDGTRPCSLLTGCVRNHQAVRSSSGLPIRPAPNGRKRSVDKIRDRSERGVF